MSDLKKLVETNDHLSLSQSENKDYKSIAFIHLGQFEKALEYSQKGTFTHCYCLYKLKKYGKCIKQLNKIKSKEDKYQLLKAQALYNLQYYNEAYEIFSKHKNSTAMINAEAIASLIKLSTSNKIQRYKPFCKDKTEKEIKSNEINFAEDERQEFEFNTTFKYLSDVDIFVKELERKIDNVYCRNQLYNVTGEYEKINDGLSQRQKEIVEFNKNGNELEGLMHFQKKNAEYEFFNNKKDKERSDLIRDYLFIKNWYETKDKKEVDVNKINDEELREMMSILTRKKLSQEELKNIILRYSK